ncbi:head GIN domain-containing protein [Ramlibacter albus]|uniref:DUF2807 domain-containing protein n=1 Tax=Ramlibacter albus TaxID=2079448 RepID=A0A923M860_9BURK|nr:head GIN domain-containing protein [Ramlibacter albus]MBC5764606.1 DUF2807 domain-containing protein [Ramlibacter albus]
MKRRLLLLLAALSAAAAHAQPSQQTLTPGPFDRLSISGNARVDLTQGPRDEVTIVGEDGVRAKVQLHLSKSGRLDISTEDDWKFWNREPVQLRVQMREISRLTISGASDIAARGPIRADNLRVDISGAGEVKLAQVNAKQLRFNISGAGEGVLGGGAVDELQLHMSGKGKVTADKMKAVQGTVVISGVGNADVWVTDDLRVVVSGVGQVNYWGQPKIRQEISAIGSVNAKGNK